MADRSYVTVKATPRAMEAIRAHDDLGAPDFEQGPEAEFSEVVGGGWDAWEELAEEGHTFVAVDHGHYTYSGAHYVGLGGELYTVLGDCEGHPMVPLEDDGTVSPKNAREAQAWAKARAEALAEIEQAWKVKG